MTALASKYPNRRWLVWIAIAVAVFYWRILFTSQFSIVEDWEAVNQGFAWHQFGAREVQSGVLPLWDPYTFSGRSHIGEMQPGLFYPPKLLLYLWPFDERDMLSVRFYNQYFALARLLGAFFMFWFALEAGIVNRFAAMIAGIGFALGGYVGSVGGSQLWDSAIWLPLVCLFLLRALRADRPGWPLLYSALAGLSLAMMLLAGGLHSAMMATIVVVTAAAYLTWEKRKGPGEFPAARELVRSSAIVLGIGVVTFAAAAIQLLPTIEYAPTVLRWGSGGTGVEKIRYEVLTHAHYQPPHALFGLLFGGADISPAEVSPYFGVLPLLLVILGVWRFWSVPLVKYAAGLAVLALVYSMGPYSLLHGVLYLVPYLDAAREPGRFIYLTHFGMALLAGFGAQALLDSDASFQPKLHRFARFFGFGVMALVLVLLVPSLYGTPAVSEWHFFSLLIFVSTYATLRYVLQPHSAAAGRLLVVAVILWDLYAFNWVVHNRMAAEKSGSDHFAQALAARPAADFFHSQPGPFRVQVEGQRPAYINMGYVCGADNRRAGRHDLD